ncbi:MULTISPECIES: DedA family protein [Thermodesulfovibrio]|jgi:membrane protein DedA with SNARE-associated domain|uniref:DedA family protein n=1 Tax=Thermodesulfovibrio TaxID=28261 RepID=UPI0026206A84|nr:DedA family protein [Thermodesulfovibrio sp.]
MDSYSFIAKFSYPGLFILLILGGIGVPFFPEDLILIACGMLISFDIIQPVPAVITSYVGLLVSDFLLYYSGRKFGRRIVLNKRFSKILSPSRFYFLEQKFIRHSTLIMLLARLLIGFRAQAFILAGITRVSVRKFLLIDAFGSAVVLSIMVSAGFIGGKFLENIKKGMIFMEYLVGLVILALIVALIVYYSYRFINKNKIEK